MYISFFLFLENLDFFFIQVLKYVYIYMLTQTACFGGNKSDYAKRSNTITTLNRYTYL